MYTAKEVQMFAKQCDTVERDAKTEQHRQGILAAKISLRKGWGEDDLKKGGEAVAFFAAALVARKIAVTPKSVERYSLAAHPQVAKRFEDVMKSAYDLPAKHPGSRVANIQEAMLREAKTGVSLAKVKAKGVDVAKKESAAAAKKKPGTQAFKSRTELVTHINASIKRKLVTYYGKDKAEELYSEVCIKAASLPNSKPFKKPAKK